MAAASGGPPPGSELAHIASTPKAVLGCVAFAVFWLMAVFPSVRFLPIGRTAGALMSAALMVAFKVLSPSEAFAAVNLPTVGLLFGTMIVSTFLERAGAFEYLGWLLAWRSLGGADLLCRLCIFSAISAALLTNDTTCVILTSFILSLCRARGLPPQPYLIALATSANVGSALTPIGNPQNLIISITGRVSFGKFLAGLAAPVVVSVLVNMVGLLGIYGRRLMKKRLRKRLEEGSTQDAGFGIKSSGGQGREIVETSEVLGSETGYEDGMGGIADVAHSDKRTESEAGSVFESAGKAGGFSGVEAAERKANSESSGSDANTIRLRSLSGSHIRNEFLQAPQRSLSLGARKRREGEVELPSSDLQSSGIVTPLNPRETAEGLGRVTDRWQKPGAVHLETASQSSGIVTPIDREGCIEETVVGLETIGVGGLVGEEEIGRAFDSAVSGQVLSDERSTEELVSYKPSTNSDTARSTSDRPNVPPSRTKRGRHQVEVLIAPPDLEHREGVPAVAPTWRGRLKRLRKKRSQWLFKAFVYTVVVGMLAALLAGLDLPWVAMGAAVILICLDFRDAEETLDQVSYSLLVFFSGMFISVEGFNRTGVPGQIWSWLEPHARLDSAAGTILLAVVVTLLSNLASNVPTVLLLGPRLAASAASTAGISETYAWLFLAFTSTVAGNLTMVGSAANLIVSEEAFRAKDGLNYKLSFWNHLRYGLPSTIVVLAVGIPLING